ncbi:MAG: hypothetical protein A2Z11_03235 [Candidatus Woykebacteria bacterium RBG_16_43_9]|uniref:Uncharacterized protein n=1 Tax=Candidatus Woykebacteria bacterium RBG_16_43_9 TaxID=1802596 RepID=A0A1G1WHG1_9BACT|nr:MAG: hypothetical protein A2Z11_03235 [Candidatus Woykebacteria bacterium RBG_16_43_9]
MVAGGIWWFAVVGGSGYVHHFLMTTEVALVAAKFVVGAAMSKKPRFLLTLTSHFPSFDLKYIPYEQI